MFRIRAVYFRIITLIERKGKWKKKKINRVLFVRGTDVLDGYCLSLVLAVSVLEID